ncbi:ATP-binding protein [Candidatus Woesearchaeota archaeon]|nr:ATP-binding protein [Candidatus Woesearchaeota archaeon]
MIKGQPDFVLDWEKALGFKGDPFADKIILPASRFLVNRDEEKEKVNWFFIKGYTFGRIVGEHGVGKTMLLKWLEERLNKYNRIHCVYINAAFFKEQINIPHQILLPLLSYYEQYVSKPHTKMINFDFMSFLKKKLGHKSVTLLVDNAHHLTDRNIELLKTLREDGLRLQIIVASNHGDYEKSRLAELGHDELNINLRRLTLEECKALIRRRVEAFGGKGVEPLNDEIITALYEKAEKNTRQFIFLCRDEAIRRLIHKTEMMMSQMVENRGVAQAKAAREQRKKLADENFEPEMDAPEKMEVFDLEPKKKRKFFNIKFDFSKEASEKGILPSRSELWRPSSKNDDKKAIFNDDFKDNLLSKLSRPSPIKRASPGKKEDFAEIDRLLHEITKEKDKKGK